MKPSTRNMVKGAKRQTVGTAKAVAGKMTGKKGLEAKGRLQAGAGKLQSKLGKAEADADRDLRKRRP